MPPHKPNHPRAITEGVAKPIAIISSAGELYVLDYRNMTLSAFDEKTLGRVAVNRRASNARVP